MDFKKYGLGFVLIIETEYIVPSGSSDKRCDIMVFDNNEEAFLD